MLISLGIPVKLTWLNNQIQAVNNLLKLDKSLVFIDQYKSFTYRGRINDSMLRDATHPSTEGLTRMVVNFKRAIST